MYMCIYPHPGRSARGLLYIRLCVFIIKDEDYILDGRHKEVNRDKP